MLLLLLGAACLVAPLCAAAVAFYAGRRGRPSRLRRRWAVLVGGVSVVGFLVPHLFADSVQYLYFEVLKPRPIAVTPYELLVVNLGTGLVFSVGAVGCYVVASEIRRSDTTSP
ncbi:hypothetical protein [Haloferax gibbonsii]|uniref:Uncharacterized protein n=1 Tax=Haloferax gibbonsii TaxID=35746 RepID=A0A871BIP1_HALGI|nr:hypothetical protein [Haloferax gibbonsii]QOS12676.1 uncharacterized protein HfgLR_12700 [Haloferax gibbonsii]